MKLYIYEHCPFCTRARMIVGLKCLPVTLEVVMEGDAKTPIRLIGKKALPILRKDDGSHIGESLDIVRYLDSLGPTALLAPQDRALDEWIKEVWPTALRLFIPRFVEGNFAEIATPEAKQAYRQREELAFGNLEMPVLRSLSIVREIEFPKLVRDYMERLSDSCGVPLLFEHHG